MGSCKLLHFAHQLFNSMSFAQLFSDNHLLIHLIIPFFPYYVIVCLHQLVGKILHLPSLF